jgi:NADP-dependent 3-hydroxy acid dehydrogenase YdfG
MVRTVWTTGAGSGMGRATALAAARSGWRVALSGRRPEALEAVAAEIAGLGGEALVVPLDVTDRAAVRAAADRIAAELGPVDAVVLSAGLNAPRRYWRDQDLDEFAAITATNLLGPVAVVDAVLPGMRERGTGTVVFISSYSGWRFSPDAGAAYSASKTALGPLTQTLNAQENRHGIRACHLCPGDVDSDFLSRRPVVPGDDDRAVMLTPDDIARTVLFVLESPPHVVIDELVVSPAKPAPPG